MLRLRAPIAPAASAWDSLRRVNCWAAVIREPIFYAYPAFRGTRDYRLVQIMKKRINNFSLLLGGVQDFDVDEIVGSEEAWRNQIVALAKKELEKAGGRLRAAHFTALGARTERSRTIQQGSGVANKVIR
jgi:hypothetical protein